jgi:hypothetical protein
MNPKLQKYIARRDRIIKRIDDLQGELTVLDKKIAELERLELQSMLRGANMTYQDLTAYIQAKAAPSALPETERSEREENANDEDE